MRKQYPSLLLHPFFIACLLLLLVNDFVLKQQLHNWLTGKLSDVAGMAVFALFFASLLPRYKSHVYIATALLFLWWKSTLSQPFIQLCNMVHLPVTRVVDYTDYIALLVLPLAWQCNPAIHTRFYKKLAAYSTAAISLFAFCATSLPYRYLPTSPTSIESHYSQPIHLSLQQVAMRLDSMGIQYTIDSFNVYPETYFNTVHFRGESNNMQYFYKQKDPAADSIIITNLPKATTSNLYRRYATSPYILVHNLTVDGEVIPAVKLATKRDAYLGNDHTLWMEEIELTQDAYDKYLGRPNKTTKYYKNKIYAALLSKLQ